MTIEIHEPKANLKIDITKKDTREDYCTHCGSQMVYPSDKRIVKIKYCPNCTEPE